MLHASDLRGGIIDCNLWHRLRKATLSVFFNPLLPSVPYMTRSAKILILILEGIIKKIPMSVATMSR